MIQIDISNNPLNQENYMKLFEITKSKKDRLIFDNKITEKNERNSPVVHKVKDLNHYFDNKNIASKFSPNIFSSAHSNSSKRENN